MEKTVKYEHILIARQDLAPSSVESLVTKFSEILKNNGGATSKVEYCGLRPLAYPVKKNRKGHYILMNISSTPACLKELERNEHISEDVLRFATIKKEEHEAGPSQLLKQSRNYIDSFANSSKVFSNKELASQMAVEEEQAQERSN